MSRFEFLMMIAAVVVAVGMTEIVGGWGRLMRTRAIVRPYWLHLAWTTMILFSLIQYWTGMWSYSGVPIEGMVQIFFLIMPSLFGVLAAFAITPDVPMEGELNVRDYYWAKNKAVFLPLAAYVATALIADLVIIGFDKITIGEAISYFVGAALFSMLAFMNKQWIHATGLGGWAAFFILSLVV